MPDILSISPANLIGFWPMDDGAGQVIRELSGNSPAGVGHGLTWDASGCNFGGAAWIDILPPSNPLEGTIFIEALSGATVRGLVTLANAAKTRFAYLSRQPVTDLIFSVYQGLNQFSIIPADPGRVGWYGIALTWSQTSGKMTLSVSGKPTLSIPITPVAWNTEIAAIGKNLISGVFCTGHLRNCAIWDIMLDSGQIEKLGDFKMALTGQYSQTRMDYDGETSSFGFRTTTLTAANFDAQHALKVALAAAVTNICLGVKVRDSEANQDFITNTPPDDPLAQRENKWLVTYVDTVTEKLYKVELPCADLTHLDPNDRKHAEIGDAGHVDAFITAFEAYALSEVGNAVEVQEITFVGRNL